MLSEIAETAVRQIMTAISLGDYEAALAQTSGSRCSAADLAQVIREYGRPFSAPPFSDWDIVGLASGGGQERWSVRAPFWSRDEGGRSDLELHLTVTVKGESLAVELDDILVP
jgi:hypothetical protein